MNSSDCYCLKMKKASNSLTNFYDQKLAASGVTLGQYFTLLNVATCKRGTIKELADMAGLDRSTLARNIKVLIKQGLVIDAKEDGCRDSKIVLSETGRQTYHQAKKLWEQAQLDIQAYLGEDDEKLDQLLKKLSEIK